MESGRRFLFPRDVEEVFAASALHVTCDEDGCERELLALPGPSFAVASQEGRAIFAQPRLPVVLDGDRMWMLDCVDGVAFDFPRRTEGRREEPLPDKWWERLEPRTHIAHGPALQREGSSEDSVCSLWAELGPCFSAAGLARERALLELRVDLSARYVIERVALAGAPQSPVLARCAVASLRGAWVGECGAGEGRYRLFVERRPAPPRQPVPAPQVTDPFDAPGARDEKATH